MPVHDRRRSGRGHVFRSIASNVPFRRRHVVSGFRLTVLHGKLDQPQVSLAEYGAALAQIPAHLVEANVLGLLTEALTAQVEVVLADETGSVLADAAIIPQS